MQPDGKIGFYNNDNEYLNALRETRDEDFGEFDLLEREDGMLTDGQGRPILRLS